MMRFSGSDCVCRNHCKDRLCFVCSFFFGGGGGKWIGGGEGAESADTQNCNEIPVVSLLANCTYKPTSLLHMQATYGQMIR